MSKLRGFGCLTRLLEKQLEVLNHPRNLQKGCWRDSDLDYLVGRLDEEVAELKDAVERARGAHANAPNTFSARSAEVLHEAADVANFAAFIYDVIKLMGEGKHDGRELRQGF